MTLTNSAALIKNAISAAIDESLKQQDVNLTNCDREPIHIPNAIQPHGILFAIAAEDLAILQVSENITETINLSPETVLTQSIDTIFAPNSRQAIEQHLVAETPLKAPLYLKFANDHNNRQFHTTIHQQDELIILELEHVGVENDLSCFQFFQTIKTSIERLQQTETLTQLCQAAVQQVYHLTGFDRVMIYKFHPDSSGSIIAEAVDDTAEPYLDLRYPATDIPKQARALYTLN
jgi:two-component system, chemotaxis family, sensor kinase Cph1